MLATAQRQTSQSLIFLFTTGTYAQAIRSHRNCGDGCSDRTANWALSGQCVVDAAQDLDSAHSDQGGIYAKLLRVSFSCSQPVRTLKPQYAHIVIVAPSYQSLGRLLFMKSTEGNGCSDRTANWALSGQ